MQDEISSYLKTIEEVEKNLSTDVNKGLSSKSSKKRLDEYGENQLEEKAKYQFGKYFCVNLKV